MPLIVMTGGPSSGKTTRTNELKQFFTEQAKEVHVVSEYEKIVQAGFEINSFFHDANKEKHIRAVLKSEVLKLITNSNVVILDGLNYIKGYRYELFCGTKSNRCNQCTLFTLINIDEGWKFNENRTEPAGKYDRKTYDALLMRYEEPDKKNRWDAPLFSVFPDQELDKDGIFSCLFKIKPPKPNMSTQNPPLSSTNFLYDLDQLTKEITDKLVLAKGLEGSSSVKISENLSIDVSDVTVPQLMNLRRQYITYSKMHAPDPKNIQDLFGQYLKTYLNQ